MVAAICEVWKHLERGGIIFLANKGGEFLCEGPEERSDLRHLGPVVQDEDEEIEACIRVFLTKEECEEYCSMWRELFDLAPGSSQIQPVAAILSDIWKRLPVLIANAYADYQVPTRLDVCRLPHEGYPIPLDTLYSEHEHIN